MFYSNFYRGVYVSCSIQTELQYEYPSPAMGSVLLSHLQIQSKIIGPPISHLPWPHQLAAAKHLLSSVTQIFHFMLTSHSSPPVIDTRLNFARRPTKRPVSFHLHRKLTNMLKLDLIYFFFCFSLDICWMLKECIRLGSSINFTNTCVLVLQ